MKRSLSIQHNIRRAAAKVVDHQDQINEAVWRRLFDVPKEPHLLDQTRDFAASLNDLLDIAGDELGDIDLHAVEHDVNNVIERLEKRIDGLRDPKDAMPFVAAIYVLRKRFEQIAIRVGVRN